MKKIAIITLTILLTAILFVSCGDAPLPSKTSVTGVSLNSTRLDLGVGATQTLTATVAPADATEKSVKWSSSDTSIATVDQTGKVTAVGKGKATITVTTEDGSKTATCEVITDPTLIPLTLEFKENGRVVPSAMLPFNGMFYSKDDGITRIPVTIGTSISVEANEKIRLYGDLKDHSGVMFSINCYGVEPSPSVEVYVYGNVMSLYKENGFETSTVIETTSTFYGLFNNNTNIRNHESLDLVLPATTLDNNCYRNMFNGCTSLTRAPELPATALASNCYNNMFYGCSNIKSITCLALPMSGDYFTNWMSGTGSAVTGTKEFHCKAAAINQWEFVGVIPAGWDIVGDK